MSTRSRIGIQREDGSVESIYCHFDGYPDGGVGDTLKAHWTEPEKIEQLISLGDLSVLGSEIGEDQGTDWFDNYGPQYNFGNPISQNLNAQEEWDNDPRSKWCLAYSRDRGENDVNSITHDPESWPDSWQEYEYLWINGHWEFRDTYEKSTFKPL